MVLAVTNYVWQAGIGAVFRRDAVLVDDDGPRLLNQALVAETRRDDMESRQR